MHQPDLLILDEPTSGLDPLNQQEFYNLLRERQKAGATIFLSSHVLSEVEHVCDRVGILRSGRLVHVHAVDMAETEPSLEEVFLSFFAEPRPKALPP